MLFVAPPELLLCRLVVLPIPDQVLIRRGTVCRIVLGFCGRLFGKFAVFVDALREESLHVVDHDVCVDDRLPLELLSSVVLPGVSPRWELVFDCGAITAKEFPRELGSADHHVGCDLFEEAFDGFRWSSHAKVVDIYDEKTKTSWMPEYAAPRCFGDLSNRA